MFSSKSIRGKWTWALVDLLVVIIGVYIAFLIQSSAVVKKDKKEQEKVCTALKFELEQFRLQMPGMAVYMESRVEELINVRNENRYANFYDWRFIEPQYSYQIIEYAINLQNTDIIDFELYNALQKLFVEIKKLEHAERLITSTSQKYQTLPEGLSKGDPIYQINWAKNYDNFGRFITFLNDRGRILQAIADASKIALPLINGKLDPQKRIEIEKEFVTQKIGFAPSEEAAVKMVKDYFPDFEEDEIRNLYRQAKGIKTQPPTDSTNVED